MKLAGDSFNFTNERRNSRGGESSGQSQKDQGTIYEIEEEDPRENKSSFLYIFEGKLIISRASSWTIINGNC